MFKCRLYIIKRLGFTIQNDDSGFWIKVKDTYPCFPIGFVRFGLILTEIIAT